MMKSLGRATLFLAVLVHLTGCETTPALYQWGEFPALQYQTLKGDGTAPAKQLAAMEEQAEQAKSSGLALPPGFLAHKGLLYLESGDVDRARAMLNAEKAAFPESGPYIDSLLKRINNPKRSARKPVNAS